METRLTDLKPTFIIAPPRCGTTALLRTVSSVSGSNFAISEPFRVYRKHGKNIISDAFASAKNYRGPKRWLHTLKTKNIPILDCLNSYRLNACYKETVSFHDFRDPVNSDILELVLSQSCHVVGCIRHPVAVIHSVFYRFRSNSTDFAMSEDQVKKLVNNLEAYLQFCQAFKIPVVKYEDWVEDLSALEQLRASLRVSNSIVDFTKAEYFGIGDARAESSLNARRTRDKIYDDAFCDKVYRFSGAMLREAYPQAVPS